MTHDSIELNRRIWQEKYSDNASTPWEWWVHIALILMIRKRPKRVLDYACGNGRVGHHIKAFNLVAPWRMVGVDTDANARRRAALCYDEVHDTDGVTVPGKDYDMVILGSIIEHIADEPLDELMHNVYNAMSPNGLLYVVSPNKWSPRLLLTRGWDAERETAGHVNFKSQSETTELLQRHGFTKIKYSHWPWIWPFYLIKNSFVITARKKG